jgi:hypothetical protein
LNKEIKDIINKLNDVIKNLDLYYNIYNNILNNYNEHKKNYEILQNINAFNNYNNIIINDIKQILDDSNDFSKCKNIINMYNKMNTNNLNSNYIIAEIEIKEDNKDIRILNSYESYKKEFCGGKLEDGYKNEKLIAETIDIEIDNIKIPFSYFHNFKKKGKYKIK